MQFNKNDFQSVAGLFCLVICSITFISVNYLWLFAPYGHGRSGLIKNLIINAVCLGGIWYGKKTLKIEFGKKNGPR